MTIPFEKLKARLLANPKVKAEYDALAPEFEIAAELLRVRLRAGLSQAELAASESRGMGMIPRRLSLSRFTQRQRNYPVAVRITDYPFTLLPQHKGLSPNTFIGNIRFRGKNCGGRKSR